MRFKRKIVDNVDKYCTQFLPHNKKNIIKSAKNLTLGLSRKLSETVHLIEYSIILSLGT